MQLPVALSPEQKDPIFFPFCNLFNHGIYVWLVDWLGICDPLPVGPQFAAMQAGVMLCAPPYVLAFLISEIGIVRRTHGPFRQYHAYDTIVAFAIFITVHAVARLQKASYE